MCLLTSKMVTKSSERMAIEYLYHRNDQYQGDVHTS